MADDRRHGEGQHDERDMAMPTVPPPATPHGFAARSLLLAPPRAGLVVVEAEFILGRFEAVFDGPAVALDPDQGRDISTGRTPGREIGQIAIRDVAADQQAACPLAGSGLVKVGTIEICQRAVPLRQLLQPAVLAGASSWLRPIIKPRSLGAVAR